MPCPRPQDKDKESRAHDPPAGLVSSDPPSYREGGVARVLTVVLSFGGFYPQKQKLFFFFFFPDDLIQSRQNRTKSKAKPTPNQQNKLNQSKQKTKTAFSLNEPKRRVGEGRGGEGLFCMAVVMRP